MVRLSVIWQAPWERTEQHWVFALATLTSTEYKQNRLFTCRNRDTLQTCYCLWCTVRLYAIWPLPTRVLAPSDTRGRADQLCWFEPWQLSPVPSISNAYCKISMKNIPRSLVCFISSIQYLNSYNEFSDWSFLLWQIAPVSSSVISDR